MSTSKTIGERLVNGILKENPTFVLMLGMCPTLAVTTSAVNGFGMGATTMVVLALSNLIISLLRNIIPNKVRIPAFIVIIASFVTMVQLLLQAYLSSLNDALGVYIPLIVVNCIILGRAESYAYSNPPIPSLFDGIGMGLGFTIALTIIGGFREILGTGKIFGAQIMPSFYTPIGIMVLAPGAFFVLAFLCAAQNYAKHKLEAMGKDASKIGSGCSEDCMNCNVKGCNKRFYDESELLKVEDDVDDSDFSYEVEENRTEDSELQEDVGNENSEEEVFIEFEDIDEEFVTESDTVLEHDGVNADESDVTDIQNEISGEISASVENMPEEEAEGNNELEEEAQKVQEGIEQTEEEAQETQEVIEQTEEEAQVIQDKIEQTQDDLPKIEKEIEQSVEKSEKTQEESKTQSEETSEKKVTFERRVVQVTPDLEEYEVGKNPKGIVKGKEHVETYTPTLDVSKLVEDVDDMLIIDLNEEGE